MKLQVTNIARNLSAEDFEKLFTKYAPLKECTLVMDAVTGKSKGFGFVIIAKFETAKKAATETHGRVVNGQKIKVKLLD